jgi:hypothetical protein
MRTIRYSETEIDCEATASILFTLIKGSLLGRLFSNLHVKREVQRPKRVDHDETLVVGVHFNVNIAL